MVAPTGNTPVVSKRKVAKKFRLFNGGRTQFAPTVNTPIVSKRKVAKKFRLFNGGRPMVAPTGNTPVVSKRKVAKKFRLFNGGRTQFAPTVEQSEHVDCERKFVRFRVVEFSLRLVSQGDLPSANSRSDTTPWCHTLRSRRFATSPPTIELRLWCQKEKWLRNLGNLRAGDQWSPLRSNKASMSIASENSFVFGASRTVDPYSSKGQLP